MSTKPIKKKFAHQTIETVTEFLITKNSIYITVITFLAVIAPFLHLFASPGQPGLFGFKYMSSFLFSLGWPITTICLGLLLQLGTAFMDTGIQNAFNFVSNLIIALGVFYLLYTLIPISDFTPSIYYTMLFATTAAAGYSIYLFSRGIQLAEEKLKVVINKLITLLVKSEQYMEKPENRSKHFKEYMKELEEIVE